MKEDRETKEREEKGKRSPVLAPASILLVGCPGSWIMYAWVLWGYVFIDNFCLFIAVSLSMQISSHMQFIPLDPSGNRLEGGGVLW